MDNSPKKENSTIIILLTLMPMAGLVKFFSPQNTAEDSQEKAGITVFR